MVETRLFAFHKMIIVVMEMYLLKIKPQVVSYRKCKDFHNDSFLDLLRDELNPKMLGEGVNLTPHPLVFPKMHLLEMG